MPRSLKIAKAKALDISHSGIAPAHIDVTDLATDW
jgi:hypothetical protein